ncbi:MAG TPA: hypothetical protein VJV05_09620 [Pyrinomonadaceae bacterium]|nr:hypothetical protein [Pyrinomonadaceae bacterium]
MTPTKYRDQVAQLAKTKVLEASEVAEKITDPWFQAQAWAHLIRYAERPLLFARKAAKAATQGRDDYQRSAVRAWEIAALAERGFTQQARRSLQAALELGASVEQVSSRAEGLLLLVQAAFKLSREDAADAAIVFNRTCTSNHWRAARARKDIEKMLRGEMPPREFFW